MSVSSSLGPEAIRDGMGSTFNEGQALTTPWLFMSTECKVRSQYDGEDPGRNGAMFRDCRVNKAWVRARPVWHWVKVRLRREDSYEVTPCSSIPGGYSGRLFRAAISVSTENDRKKSCHE
jgi:hypothetical protein